MKRYSLALFAVLALGFIGLSPSKAQAAVSCSELSNNGYYPQGYLTWCASSTYNSSKQDALTGLYTLSATFADAKKKLTVSPTTQFFFVFNSVADLMSYCTATGNTTSNPPVPVCPSSTPPSGINGVTWRSGSAGSYVYWSAAIMTNIAGGASTYGYHVGNTLVHEAGHQLDAVYGQSIYGGGAASQEFTDTQERITGTEIVIGGTPEVPNAVDLTFDFSGGIAYGVDYSIHAGDTPTDVAIAVAAAINNFSTFHQTAFKTQATSVGTSVYITTHADIWYDVSVSGTTPPNYVTATIKANAAFDISKLDTLSFATDQCNPIGSLYLGQMDQSGAFICSGTTGNGTTLSPKYSGLYENRNDLILPKAWSIGGYFSVQGPATSPVAPAWCGTGFCWSEFWAEDIAKRIAPMTGNENPDTYLGTGHFPCATAAIDAILTAGVKPTAGDLSPNCN